MTIEDHDELLRIWRSVAGLFSDESDSYENMRTFLKRNQKLNYVAVADNKIVGTIRCAQDGHRGYISHLAVLPEFRGGGLAKKLYEKSMGELRRQGIWACDLYVLDSNPEALEFWKHNGWEVVEYDFRMLQRKLD